MNNFAKDKIRILCDNLKGQSVTRHFDLTNVECVKACGYKKDNNPPKEGWMPQPEMGFNGAKDEHYWFRAKFRTPKAIEGEQFYLGLSTGFSSGWDIVNHQCIIYLNGEMVQGCDLNHQEAYLEPDTEYEVHNYYYVGMNEGRVCPKMFVFSVNEKIEKLYYDIFVAYKSCEIFSENSDEYFKMMPILERTANLIDMRSVGSKEYFESIDKAQEFIDKELYENLCSSEGKPIVRCIGHTHIDVEWLWARDQTREKIQRSFSTAKALMDHYPEYKFTLSQPELYRYLKEEAPEKYAELKELVTKGQWEPEGAMWVEADCNLVSGESFVRQILQGTRFFKNEFGVENKILLLPDVFGYSAALPQILKKCGIRHFVTSKISWNEYNTMPYDCFMWQGIDGTEIFTNFITTRNYDGGQMIRFTTYVGDLTPTQIKGTWNRFQQKEYTNRTFTTFGHGDGGGGPTKEMLETQRRLSKGLPGMPVTETGFLLEHLDAVRKDFDENCAKLKTMPKWVGELYLEYHRGTYTSMAKNKRGNRKSELMLQKAEALSMIDLLSGGNYDAEGIYHTWNLVLHDQFHDIIPGSSILEVYEGTDKDYAIIADYCNGVIDSKLARLAEQVSANNGTLVYNSLGFDRNGPVVVDGKTVETKGVIPAFGWAVSDDFMTETDVKINGLTAENKYYILTLDKAGRIESLYDKRAEREVMLSGQFGNEIQIFEDFPRQYDAWEITDYYKQKMWVLDTEATITAVTDGSRAGFKVERKYNNSTITQNIWLYSECERIDFENDIDWHERHQLLKAAFPFDVHATSATYEIQFGHLERVTHENTSWDKAKFEVCAHKWVDVSENGYGVALLNDCKYGYNTEGSTLKISMLKCATYPNPEADQGKHVFTYSLMPHVGDFREAGVIHEAYALNQPLSATSVISGNGTLPSTFSLVSCDKDNVVIETVKKAEDDDSMIVRLYDAFNRRSKATVTVNGDFKACYLCDMLENNEQQLDLVDGKVTLPVSNFEIITLKFTKQIR